MKVISSFFVGAITLLCLQSACSEKPKHQVLDLTDYDSIAVTIDYPILSSYSRLQPYIRNGEMYVVGYNHFEHYYDFINLSGGKHFSVELQREGADGVLTPSDFVVLQDEIVCKNQEGVIVVGMDGKVKHRLPMQELVHPENVYSATPRTATLGNYNYWDADGNRVFIPLYPLVSGVPAGKIYDAEKHTLEPLPFSYPDSIQQAIQSLGSLSAPSVNGDADRIVYNYPISSKVYLYDWKTKDTKVIDMRSLTVSNELDISEFNIPDQKGRFTKEMLSSRFNWVHYHAESGRYYRVHLASIESMKKMFDRKSYLMVYDEKKNETKEYLLPEDFSNVYVVQGDVMYVAYKKNTDDVFRLAKIELENL